VNDIRETLDELELVLDLAALVGDLLLSAVLVSPIARFRFIVLANLRLQLIGAGTVFE
jgi:hypothetical protein